MREEKHNKNQKNKQTTKQDNNNWMALLCTLIQVKKEELFSWEEDSW